MRMTLKSLLFAPLAVSTSLSAAMAQDTSTTGYAGTPLGLSLRSVEGAAPDHSVACLDAAGGAFDCVVWTSSDAAISMAQAVNDGTRLLGLRAIDTAIANPAVAVVVDGREVPGGKFDRIAAALDAELGTLGGAARVSVRRPGTDEAAFGDPAVPRDALRAASDTESGRLWRSIDAALDDLATFEARPRTLVVAAGEASSERRFDQLAVRAAALGVRVVVVRLGGDAGDGARLSGFAESAGGEYVDLSADAAVLPDGFANRLSRSWRLAFTRDGDGSVTDIAAFRFDDGTRTEFAVGETGETVLRVGAAPAPESLTMRLAGFLPEIRPADVLDAVGGNAAWLALVGFAGLSLGSGLFFLRRRKVAIAPVAYYAPAAPTDVDDAHGTATAAETEVATEVQASAALQFVGSDRTEVLRHGEVRIGRSREANDIVVDAPAVSRRHAVIRIAPDGTATVENLTARDDSASRVANPVVVNGVMIESVAALSDGDEVQLGEHGGVRLRFARYAS